MKNELIQEATILVIDDEPKWQELLQCAFPQYKCIGAKSGGEGLELLRKPNDIDLVILDYKMGLMTGIEVLKKIRQINPALGVILMTAFGSKDVVVEALEQHADDFIDKPFRIEDTRQKIENVLEARYRRQKESGRADGSVQRVVRFLERNYDKPFTLDDAALVASLSPKYLSRLFKEETGKGLTEFKIALKIDKARELLESTSFSVKEIAEKLGYESAEAFEKVFKRIEGRTPTEYRHLTQVEKGQ